jgi:hypothetical protein
MSNPEELPWGFNAGSIRALYCEIFAVADAEIPCATGTAFIGWCNVMGESNCFKAALLTARHNVTGKNHFPPHDWISIEMKMTPQKMRVYFPCIENPQKWFAHDFPLCESDDANQPNWLEHLTLKADVDVVGFPLNLELLDRVHDGCLVCLHRTSNEINENLRASSTVQVIGFPLKRKDNYLAVWSGGAIAYEPTYDFPLIFKNGVEKTYPVYLISARTFSGQSGSLVVRHAGENGWWQNSYFTTASGTKGEILGMYTCRLNADGTGSDLGFVWRQHVLFEILNASSVIHRT